MDPEAIWRDLCPADRLRDGKLLGFRIGGVKLCAGRSGDRFFALDDTCPHAGGSLAEGLIDEDLVVCPLHAYAFEVESGRCIDDPACSVGAYPIRVENGMLQVRLRRQESIP